MKAATPKTPSPPMTPNNRVSTASMPPATVNGPTNVRRTPRNGTYRIEKRHRDDPLKPYLAPIRNDLPKFTMPLEWTMPAHPVMRPPPVRLRCDCGCVDAILPGELAHMYRIQEVFVPFKSEDQQRGDISDVRVKMEVDEQAEAAAKLRMAPMSPGARKIKVEGRDVI